MAARSTGLRVTLLNNEGRAWPAQVEAVEEAQKSLDQPSSMIDLIGSADARKKAGDVWADLLAVHAALLIGDLRSEKKIKEFVALAQAVQARIPGEIVRAF